MKGCIAWEWIFTDQSEILILFLSLVLHSPLFFLSLHFPRPQLKFLFPCLAFPFHICQVGVFFWCRQATTTCLFNANVCVCVCVCVFCSRLHPLLIQQNDGSGGFNRPWAEYKVGFGDPSGNYWLGNDLLSQLTANNRYKLRFDLQSNYSNWYYAEYSTFRVLSEADNYTLQVEPLLVAVVGCQLTE